MRKNTPLLLLVATFLSIFQIQAQCSAVDFEEQDGIAVIEMETASNLPADWNRETAPTGFTGDALIAWRAANFLDSPGNGTITYKIKINTPGVYRFQWRNKVGIGNESTEHNDSWLRFPDASDFFAQKGTSIKYPRGGTFKKSENTVAGSSESGWMKVYLSGTTEYTWTSFTSDNDTHNVYAEFDAPGVYTIEVSGRSEGHLIDRMVLYNEERYTETEAIDITRAETLCTSAPSEECGNLLITFNKINPIICGGDGSITTTISGAEGTLNYLWSTGATSPDISAIPAGDYALTVTDATGCSKTANVLLVDPEKPTVSITSFSDVLDTDAPFMLSGGSPVGGTYAGPGITDNSFDPAIGAGTYPITYSYTDPSTQCTASISTEIRVVANTTGCNDISLSLQTTDISNCGAANGRIVTAISGAQAPVSYHWSNGASSSDISNLAPGDYSLTITDGNGCSLTRFAVINEPLKPSVSLDPFESLKETDAPVVLNGGSPAGGSYSGAGVSNGIFDPSIGNGVYTITYSYTDSLTNCTNEASQLLIVEKIPAPPVLQSFTFINADTNEDVDLITENKEFIINDIAASGFTIRVNLADDSALTGSVFLNLEGPFNSIKTENSIPYALFGGSSNNYVGVSFAPGTYTITATPFSGKNGQGLEGETLSVSFTISEEEVNCSEIPEVSLLPFSPITPNDNAFTLSGGFPEGGLYDGEGVSEGMFNPSNLPTGIYPITYTYTDTNTGCSNTAVQTIEIVPELSIKDQPFVFPNPIVNGTYKTKIPKGTMGTLNFAIYTGVGKKIAGGTIEANSEILDFDISNLAVPRGLYRMVIEGGNLSEPIGISFVSK